MYVYLSNALKNKNFLKRRLVKIYDWYEDQEEKFIDYAWVTKAEDNKCINFKTLYKSQKKIADLRGEEFAFKINKKIKSLKNIAPSLIEKRLRCVYKLLALPEIEQELLGLLVRIKTDENIENFCRNICGRSFKKKDAASLYLSIKPSKLEELFDNSALLFQLGLVEREFNGDVYASDLIIKLLLQNIKNVSDIKNIILGKKCKSSLEWNDFTHVEEKDFCARIFEKAVKNKEKGVNLLIYGEPGTGKTEFAKTLAQQINAEIYAIGEKFEDVERKDSLKLACSILAKDNNVCLLIDEADDFLEEGCYFFSRKKENDKLYVNRLLENNQTPTIWIINSIEKIDKSYLRRFTYALNFTKPNLKIRTAIWQKKLKANKLPAGYDVAKDFAIQYKLPPSFITTAVRSAKLAGGGLLEVKQSLKSLEKAYNNGHFVMPKMTNKNCFNPKLLNTDTDLELLTTRIKTLSQRNFSLCLYGVSGTGKSAYGEYLSEILGLPIVKKKCSDLLSKWVGGTEENIASAFNEGLENQAVLIFDEADSFLQDRSEAFHSWEVTQVNEMLTQMENYPYPFVCTTNLMDSLDKASLRRFTFKVAYDYMTEEQSCMAFKHFFNIADVNLSHLNSLVPGDFVVVKQKAEILGLLQNKNELIKMLEQEQKNKAPVQHKMGFL